MSEWHDYSPDNISSCQECKELHDKNKDEDAQLEDYHPIVPIGDKTFSQKYSIPENKNNKKRGYDASLSDSNRGENVRFKKGNYGNSQLDNLEVYDEDGDDTMNSISGGKKRRTHRRKTLRKRKTNRKKTHKKRRRSIKKRRN
jgi:hypothetical protein